MKVSFFIGSMEHGGAERVVSLLANGFFDLGHEIEIVLLLKNVVNNEKYKLDRFKIVDLSPRSGGYIKNSFFWLRKIRKYLKKSKPDKIISFVGRINCLVLTSSVGLGIPTYVSERNDPRHDGRGRLFMKYCNLIYRKAEKVIFQTEYEKACFSPKVQRKGVVLPNPVEVSDVWCAQHNPNEFVIVNTARLTKQKNLLLLVKATENLLSAGYSVHCVIYGEGELRSELENYVRERGLESYVSFPGNVNDVCAHIKSANLFVQTSLFEGLSNSLIEAMMMGIPVVCTVYPGIEELVADGYNGLLVNQNDLERLVDVISSLIKDPSLMENLSKNARDSTMRFSPQSVVRRWKEETDL